jgi:hypothetical protein
VEYSTDLADRLAKELHPFLSGKIPICRLRELGWFDFLSLDHPVATGAVEMAVEAFLYLSLDQEGNWNRIHEILVGIVGYLAEKTGKTPHGSEFKRLKALLEARPVVAGNIHKWFHKVYP